MDNWSDNNNKENKTTWSVIKEGHTHFHGARMANTALSVGKGGLGGLSNGMTSEMHFEVAVLEEEQ